MKNNLPLILGSGVFQSKKRYRNRKITQKRTVNCFEIELFCADGGVSHLNEKAFPIHKGNLLIAHPGDMRFSELDFSCQYIHAEITDKLILRLLDSVPRFFMYDLSELSVFFDKINKTMLSFNEYDMLIANAKLFELLYEIKEKNEGLYINHTENRKNTASINKAVEYMQNHFQEHITVEDIAKHCNLSISYFYKLFLESTEMTPNAFLNNIRISAAKKMLVSSDSMLDVVAEKCGFTSQVYFTYCFKQSTGISPGKFRTSEKYPL